MEPRSSTHNKRGWISALCLVSLANACITDKVEPEANPDEDGDGVPQEDDCDPRDPDVGAATPWYLDLDGDGYGETDVETEPTCAGPEGYASTAGDCDEADPSRYPGAPELCDDGIVQDCDGSQAMAFEACQWVGEVLLADAEAHLTGEVSGDEAGWSVAAAGDVNGDGRADLLVGARHHDAGGADAGAAYLALGPVTADLSLANASARLIGEESEDEAGFSVSSAGDVDGDGLDDLFVGAPNLGAADAGAAYFVEGPVTGDLRLADAESRLVGEPGDNAGYCVSTAGDVDGDGRDDLLVGAPENETGGTWAGAAYLVLGPATVGLGLEDADGRLIGEPLSGAGTSVSTAGDMDGDGQDDLLIGVPFSDVGGSYAGAAYVALGPATGDLDFTVVDAWLIGEEYLDGAGVSVAAAGDVDGDGREDVLIGARHHDAAGSDSGAAYLVLGPVTGERRLVDADARLLGEESYNWAGHSVSTAGDVDGDGSADLLVGAPSFTRSDLYAGAVYLVLGPVSGSLELASADAKFVGEPLDDTGRSVSTAGDVNADGRSDLLIGAPVFEVGDEYAGTAHLLLSPSY